MKKTRLSKPLAILLALIMVLSLLPMTALATDVTFGVRYDADHTDGITIAKTEMARTTYLIKCAADTSSIQLNHEVGSDVAILLDIQGNYAIDPGNLFENPSPTNGDCYSDGWWTINLSNFTSLPSDFSTSYYFYSASATFYLIEVWNNNGDAACKIYVQVGGSTQTAEIDFDDNSKVNELGYDNYDDPVYLATVPAGTTDVYFTSTSNTYSIDAIYDFFSTNEICDNPIPLNDSYVVTYTALQEKLSSYGFDTIYSALPIGTYYGFNIYDDTNGYYPYVLIYVTGSGGSTQTADRTELNAAIASVTGANADEYYQTGDRYNGTDYIGSNATPNGFYAALTAADGPLAQAQNLASDAMQSAVNAKLATLNAAIAKLISRQNVNPTTLYDIYRTANAKYTDTQTNPSHYTSPSWNCFIAALNNAGALLDDLYEQDGSPSGRNIGPDSTVTPVPSDAIYQSNVDAAAHELDDLYAGLLQIYEVNQGIFWQKHVSAMLDQFKAAYNVPTAYESTSYGTFKSAYDAAQAYYIQNGAVTEASSKSVVYGYQAQASALWNSYYTGVKSAGSNLNVSFRVADNRALNDNPEYILNPKEGTYYNNHVTLSDGHFTLQNLVDAAGLSLDAKGDGRDNMYEWLVYLNGVLVRPADYSSDLNGLSISRSSNPYAVDWTDLLLRDGDQVVLLLAPAPTAAYYISLNTAAFNKTITYLGVLQFADHAASVQEGQNLALNISRVSGYPVTYDGTSTPFCRAKVLAVKLDANGVPTAYRTLDGVTDAQGNVTTKIYEAGDYVLVAFNPTVDTANYMYPSLAAAARTTITIAPLDAAAMSAAKAEQITLLDNLLASCDEIAVGPAKWAQIQSCYQTGKGNINNAASLQAARDVVVAAQAAIAALVNEANTANKTAADLMTHYLALLPSIEQIKAGLFMQRDVPRMGIAISHFGAMTDYQKARLTVAQMQQWDALLAAYGTDGSTLPQNQEYTITINVVGGHAEDLYNASLSYNYYNADASGVIYQMFIRRESISSLSTPYVSTYGLDGEEKFGFSFRMPVTDAFLIDHMEVTGVEYTESHTYYQTVSPYHGYNVGFLENPRSDITITIYTQSGDSIDFIRTSAKSTLTAAYQGYSKAGYSSARWSDLTTAYNAGLAAINAAEDTTAINSAKAAAISAMAAVKTLVQEAVSGSTIGTHGTAHVIIENTTYQGGAFYGTAAIADIDVPLDDDSTMMTAALYALEQEGFTWTGTGGSRGSSAKDDTITYLASISKGGDTLGEFTGSAKSGWMGTLNDWFVNEGFQSFSVYANNKSYILRDGDEIRIMYTDKYGEDLSGTWGNADTALSDLTVSDGNLEPSFQSDTIGYVLSTQGNSVSVTPSAENKNYQVRIYLNETTGNNWYRRGESIPVKPGDTINIGVGDYSWPSMNNQSGNTIAYSGTWYSFKIVSSTSADSVIALIQQISKITYSNYETAKSKVTLARSAYDVLIDTAKGRVTNYAALTNAENTISRYASIDAVKSLLVAIPAADKLTAADKSKVQVAYDAYSKLDAEQQKYITVGDAKKYNDAVEWLKAQGITAPSTIVGSVKDPESGVLGATTKLTPTVTATGGVAAVTLGANNVAGAIEDAKDSGSDAIVIEPEITGTAKKVTVDLPKASLSSIASETNADLTVETPVGNLTIPNDVLASIASQASGSSVTMSLEAVNTSTLTAAQQVAVGDDPVYDISILSGGTHISSFGGGTITISLPYTLKPGEDPANVTIWYLDDSGKLRQMTCTYDKETGLATFTTDHLSYYVVGYDEWVSPFADAKSTDWFYDAVKYASQNSLMSGSSETAFEPNVNMTRAMLVTVLYRLDGKPALTGTNAFTDVKSGQWYTDAAIWANANNIAEGYGEGLFGTNDSVTREQLATILLNYAKYKGYDITATADLSTYTDASKISGWALSAMKWANDEGLVTGRTTTTIVPSGDASRAEVAEVLMRFVENFVK